MTCFQRVSDLKKGDKMPLAVLAQVGPIFSFPIYEMASNKITAWCSP